MITHMEIVYVQYIIAVSMRRRTICASGVQFIVIWQATWCLSVSIGSDFLINKIKHIPKNCLSHVDVSIFTNNDVTVLLYIK